jgi:pimeloyl-ACP methyl ester carboxylesterase
MGLKLVIGLRGLIRGNFHWNEFPDFLKQIAPDIHFLPLEMAGNGARVTEVSHTDPICAVEDFRNEFSKWKRTHPEFQSAPVTVLAFSLGGMVALKWAELYPDEIDQLIVVNSSLKQYSPFYKRLLPQNYFDIFKNLGFGSLVQQEEVTLALSSNDPSLIKKYLPKYVEFAAQNRVRHSNFLRQLMMASRLRMTKPLSIKPIFICSRKDRMVSSTCSEVLAEKFNGPIHFNESAGHDISFDQPAWLAEKIKEFQT